MQAANHEAGLHRAKLQRKFVKQMITDKRSFILRDGWEAFVNNSRYKRGVEWNEKRLIRLVWARLRAETFASSPTDPD